MLTLQAKPAELEQEFDANFTGGAWSEQAVVDEYIREIGGADVREINMDLGTPALIYDLPGIRVGVETMRTTCP